MQEDNSIFAMLLASSTHDMKNVLASLLESVDWLYNSIDDLNAEQVAEFQKVSQLAASVNAELMQLLCFFKFEKSQYSKRLLSQDIEGFLAMQQAYLSTLLKTGKIKLEIECATFEEWPFDDVLLSSAVRNAAMNSMKFAKSKILLSADIVNNMLKITVADDGPGFPEKMWGKLEHTAGAVDLTNSSTGLGLYFAQTVAHMHVDKQDNAGFVELGCSANLGGGEFNIFIPHK